MLAILLASTLAVAAKPTPTSTPTPYPPRIVLAQIDQQQLVILWTNKMTSDASLNSGFAEVVKKYLPGMPIESARIDWDWDPYAGALVRKTTPTPAPTDGKK